MELSPFYFSFIYFLANMCICFFCLCAILMHSTSFVSTFILLFTFGFLNGLVVSSLEFYLLDL